MSDIIKKDTAEEIVGHRDRAIDCYRQAVELIAEGNKAASRATFSSTHSFTPTHRTMGSVAYRPDADSVERIRQELDRYVWLHIFDTTGLGDLFDTKKSREFHDQLEKEPPPVNVETIVSTAMGLAARASDILDESVCYLFRSLNHRFKSNSGSGFGRRLILVEAIDNGWLLSGFIRDKIQDLERAVAIVNEETPPERYGGLTGKIKKVARKTNEMEVSHGVLNARWYKNGNLHIWITDEDTIRRLNDVLARNGELELTP